MKFINWFLRRLYNIYYVFVDFWIWLDLSEGAKLFLKFWLWGGFIAVVMYVIATLIETIQLVLSSRHPQKVTDKKIDFADALLMISPISQSAIPFQRTYANFLPILFLGWMSAIYFGFVFYTQRYTKPAFFKIDLVFWQYYNICIRSLLLILIFVILVIFIVV